MDEANQEFENDRREKNMRHHNHSIEKRNVYTIEEQLKSYVMDNEYTTERHEILWHAWKHNKRWLAQLLEWVMASFPSYSRHGESHATAILHSIEMILGEKQINELSASDCFLILHVVYIHDIGMCITHMDRMELMKNREFIDFLNDAKDSSDGMIRKYANLLLLYCEQMPSSANFYELLDVKLEVYYAILYMVAEFRRRKHGNESGKRLKEWIDMPENLGAGFSTSGIPSRFFYTISACAGVHTSYDFNDIMNLHKVDTGYAHDYMHPRFAAVLLQLGDALDLDNDRFHPLVREFAGGMPHTSEIHFGKHKSIRRLRVSPEKITIEADCENAEVLRMVNNEYECIKDILKNATYHWSAICPENLSLCLPILEPITLLMQGKEVVEDLINIKFEIQQEKAFNILQGNNIYKNDSFIFLREIFQNAIDASKIQYWTDWKGSRWYTEEKNNDQLEISDMGKNLSPFSYPIEVELYLAKKEKYGESYAVLEEEQEERLIEEGRAPEKYEYGVLVRVIDHGIGMTTEDIQSISRVGSSQEQRKDLVDEMPQWLKPTAEFGIGLQSSFLASHVITAYTHPRTNEKYKITFQTTGSGGNGEIGVTPLSESDYPKAFGTIFEVFLSNDKRRKQRDEKETWDCPDPFERGYQEKRNIRQAQELQLQLALYLNSLVGEKLFPIKLRMHDFCLREKEDVEKPQTEKQELRKKIEKKLENLECSPLLYNNNFRVTDMNQIIPCYSKGKEPNIEGKEEENVTWMYWCSDEDSLRADIIDDKDIPCIGKINNDFLYALDLKKWKLYLWNYKSNVYARFGAERIQAMRDVMKRDDLDEKISQINIYYKGVYVNSVNWNEDMGLLECLDIKGKLNREFMAINRGEFTELGYQHVHDELYLPVLQAAHEALEHFDRNSEFDKVIEKMQTFISTEKSVREIQNAILSLAGLATYVQNVNAGGFPAPNGSVVSVNWIKVLERLSEEIEIKKSKKESWTDSTFFNLRVLNLQIDDKGKIEFEPTKTENIVNVMANIQRYALVSKRNNRNAIWEKYLVRFTHKDNLEKSGLEGVKKHIARLKVLWDEPERRTLISYIEDWGENLKGGLESNLEGTVFNMSQASILNQNAIYSWLMKNVPSIAMFSNRDCGLRVNILDFKYTDSMYFDSNTKWTTYERMLDAHEQKRGTRFSMIATTGYCQLAVKKNLENVYYAQRGEFSKTGQRYMILPMDGKVLADIYAEYRKRSVRFDNDYLKKDIINIIGFEKFVETVFKRIKESQSEVCSDAELERKLRDIYIIHGGQAVPEVKEEFLRKLSKLDSQKTDEDVAHVELKEDDFWKILQWTVDMSEIDETLMNQLIREKKRMEKWDILLSDEDKKNYIKRYLEACGIKKKALNCNGKGNCDSMDRLVDYVHSQGWMNLPGVQVRTLYENFISELVEDMAYQVKKDLESTVNSSFILHQIE